MIKAMVKSHKVDVVCFQETKVQEMNKVIVQSLGMGRFLEWGALNSKGAAGGVVVFWYNKVLQVLDVEVGNFSMSCLFKNCKDNEIWAFTGVYGPTQRRERPFGRSLEPLEVSGKRPSVWQVILIWLGSRRREVEKVD